ncbi:hypothetical protein GGI25_000386 [Coemansia spiralis]|uniref:Uncharacterized protein n=2 Tax=Coemansia TaxID=4863 RepID=A0A9W8G7J0_9FUNG|nr:hypothetical protein GGI25_000386 [Coemansia spiralis]
MQRSADNAKVAAEKKLERKMIDESHWRATYPDDVVSKERPKLQVVYETSYLKMLPGSSTVGSDSGTGIGGRDSIVAGRRAFQSFNQPVETSNAETGQSVQQSEDDEESESRRTLSARLDNGISSAHNAKPQSSLREKNKQLKRKRN